MSDGRDLGETYARYGRCGHEQGLCITFSVSREMGRARHAPRSDTQRTHKRLIRHAMQQERDYNGRCGNGWRVCVADEET